MADPDLVADTGKACVHSMTGKMQNIVIRVGLLLNELLDVGGHDEPAVPSGGFWFFESGAVGALHNGLIDVELVTADAVPGKPADLRGAEAHLHSQQDGELVLGSGAAVQDLADLLLGRDDDFRLVPLRQVDPQLLVRVLLVVDGGDQTVDAADGLRGQRLGQAVDLGLDHLLGQLGHTVLGDVLQVVFVDPLIPGQGGRGEDIAVPLDKILIGLLEGPGVRRGRSGQQAGRDGVDLSVGYGGILVDDPVALAVDHLFTAEFPAGQDLHLGVCQLRGGGQPLFLQPLFFCHCICLHNLI